VRIEKEWSIPRQKILKRDSDYYYHRRLVEHAEIERVAESALVSSAPSTQQGEAGPSPLTARAAVQEGLGKSNLSGKAIVKGKGKVKEEVNPELATLFEDDGEIVAVPSPESAKKKQKMNKKNKDTNASAPNGNMEPPTRPEPSEGKGKEKEKEKKRKRDSGLPTQTPSSGPSTRRTSPEKKARTTSPKKGIPPTPKVIPPTPSNPVTHNASPGPSRSAPSPTPPTVPRRAGQEPLFLDSAPSPHDTFGEPMPGFFDSRPGSRVPSTSATQSQSDPRSRVKMENLNMEDLGHSGSAGPSGVDDVEMEEESVNNALNIPEGSGRSRSASLEPPSIAPLVSPTLVADSTGTSTSPVAAVLAAANGRSSVPNSQKIAPPIAPTTDGKAKSKSPIPAAGPSKPSRSPVPAPESVVQPVARVTHTPTAPVNTAPSKIATKDDQPPALPTLPRKETGVKEATSAAAPPKEQQIQSTGPLTNKPPTTSDPTSEVAAPASTAAGPVAAVSSEPVASKAIESTVPEAAFTTRASPSPADSPPMDEPVTTFLSPSKVSRSPSLPMDISSSPIIPAEELPSPKPDQAISPPRYILNSPVKQTLPLQVDQPKPPSPIRIKMPISERPKYVQPSRIQYLSDIVDPEAAARQAKKAAKNLPPPPPHAHPSLPDRPPSAIHPSRLPLVDTGSRTPMHAPVQPRGFGATPSGPSGYGSRQSGPLADQKDSYQSKPPWEKRKHSADPLGGQSPMR
jgi:hypothetical protein